MFNFTRKTAPTSVTLLILDPKVKSERQFVNRLVPVRRLDTGEEGLLLVSHNSHWPTHLLPFATWIEGCGTPYTEEKNPKLLLGYHPTLGVSWEINTKARTVHLSLNMWGDVTPTVQRVAPSKPWVVAASVAALTLVICVAAYNLGSKVARLETQLQQSQEENDKLLQRLDKYDPCTIEDSPDETMDCR